MSKGGGGGSGPVALVVLDGWGFRRAGKGNAISLGHTPVWDRLVERGTLTLLEASGRAVGLPEGQMGNSEVGHSNLGAGRVVEQDIVRISEALASGSFFQIPEFVEHCRTVKARNGTLHILGLIGTGGVHALDKHIQGVLELAKRQGMPRVAVHAFLDGRDSPPTSGADFMRALVQTTAEKSNNATVCFVATVSGRYYAMDRDRRWDRTQLAYDAMVRGAGHTAQDPVRAVLEAYDRGETDEFVTPVVIQHDGQPAAPIRDGDGVFCINFRADRMRQMARALAMDGFDDFETRRRPKVDLVTMTEYDANFPFPIGFPTTSFSRIVAEVISDAGRTTFRTAETEKYAHVTYFFNCGAETPLKGEERLLVDSPKVATYDLQPEMSAAQVTDVLCERIEARNHDFILCNYANGDMVGHTGVLPAAVKAVETVDACLERALRSAESAGTVLLITADHGNCEVMMDPQGGPHTAHTTNPVPFVMMGDPNTHSLRSGGSLCDVGPTVLALLGLELPAEMTGRDLREGVPAK